MMEEQWGRHLAALGALGAAGVVDRGVYNSSDQVRPLGRVDNQPDFGAKTRSTTGTIKVE
jgi:hypothetical protein